MGGIYMAALGGRLLGRVESEDGTLQITLLIAAIIWPLGYFPFSRHGLMPNRLKGGALCALIIFFAFCFLSSFMSPVAMHSGAFVALTLASVWLALQFDSSLNPRQLESGLKLYAIITIAVLVGFALDDYRPGERLGNGKKILNPNSVGVVSISAGLAAMAFRNWIVRYGLIVPVFVIIYLTGSRASAIATLMGIGVIAYQRTRLASAGMKTLVMVGLFGAIAAMASYWASTESAIVDFLQLNTRDRGLGSGASGRTIAWQQTWQLFLDSPFLGVGFRAHEHIIGGSSHNGYLATLAEIGLPGFMAIMYLVLAGTYRLWKLSRQADLVYTHSIFFGLSCGYLFLAIFERFLINVGNPTSLLFLVGALLPALNIRKIPAGSFRKFSGYGVKATYGDRPS